MNAPALGPIAKNVREHSGSKIKDWAAEHRIGTTVVSEFERLGKIPPTGRIRRALERAYGLGDLSLDRIANGEPVESVLSARSTSLDDRVPQLVRQLRDILDELAQAIGQR